MTAFRIGSTGVRESRVEKVREALAGGKKMTALDLLKYMPTGTSHASLSVLLRELQEEGIVEKALRGKQFGSRECEYWLVEAQHERAS